MDVDETVLRRAVGDEAKRVIIDCTYSGRGHQQASQRWAAWNTWLGLPIVVSSGLLASGAAVSAIAGQNNQITAGLALVSAVLTATRAFFRPDELADQHGLKGTRYVALRNEARFFREVELRSGLGLDRLTLRLRDLTQRYNALSEASPRRIWRRDYDAAKRSIERGESSYENDPLWKELGN